MEALLGCWQEAQRADNLAASLCLIRSSLSLEFFEEISSLIRESESCSRILRDIYDLCAFYRNRTGIVVYYLDVILPAFLKTLKGMEMYVGNEGLEMQTRWSLMMERMGLEGGMTLAARFVMFVEFLIQLVRLLSRSPHYDSMTTEELRMRIMRLRTLQGIPAPLLPPPPVVPNQQRSLVSLTQPPPLLELDRRHWAEKLFEDQRPSSTGLRHWRESKCFGPIMTNIQLGITPGSSVLFKLPFDKNRLSITLCLQPEGPNLTRLLCRWIDRYNNALYSCFGVHELCMERKGSSLQLKRWDAVKMRPTLWSALFFKTWERMVLFHCAFGALKSRCPLTLNVWPDDVVLAGEKRLYQGKILDDDYELVLTVLQDKCGGIRLHAAVKERDLKRCPVWTAFVTTQSTTSSWLTRLSRHRIWLRDLHPYVFCQRYRKRHQMERDGEFELYFMNEEAADAFQDIFAEETEASGQEALEMSGGLGSGDEDGGESEGGDGSGS